MTKRNTHPVEDLIPVHNFPRSHYQTEDNMKRYRKVVKNESAVVNRRGLSPVQKALIVKQKSAKAETAPKRRRD